MKAIALLTSGGDAPGMNAAIRAVTRTANNLGVKVYGVEDGFEGLINNKINLLTVRDVGNIIHQGGTILGSARSLEFKSPAKQLQCIEQLKQRGIEGLIVIGGNGSQTGAAALHNLQFPVVGIASTIDNDLVGTDQTIGFATAVNTATEAIDRLRTTACSHHRVFIVEVMGRDCGAIALEAGLASGAESVLIPEQSPDFSKLISSLKRSQKERKQQSILVVAEGCELNGEELLNKLLPFTHSYTETQSNQLKALQKDQSPFLTSPPRLTVLGHLQRGGVPIAADRTLATRLGIQAVQVLVKEKQSGVLVGTQKGDTCLTQLNAVATKTKHPSSSLLTEIDKLAH